MISATLDMEDGHYSPCQHLKVSDRELSVPGLNQKFKIA